MAQKSNLTSIKQIDYLGSIENLSSKKFLISNTFLNAISQIMSIKDLVVINKILSFNGSSAILNIFVFFKCAKISKFSKKFKKMQKFKQLTTEKIVNKNPTNFNNNSRMLQLAKSVFSAYNITALKLKFTVLNFFVKKKLVRAIASKLKKFLKILFARRTKLFLDFVQIIALYVHNRISSKHILYFFSIIFVRLRKRKQLIFLSFVKILFELIIVELPKRFKIASHRISGVKFILKGNLGGKTRKSSKIVGVGSVPCQTLYKDVEFAKTSITTSYGVFGMRMWVYRTP